MGIVVRALLSQPSSISVASKNVDVGLHTYFCGVGGYRLSQGSPGHGIWCWGVCGRPPAGRSGVVWSREMSVHFDRAKLSLLRGPVHICCSDRNVIVLKMWCLDNDGDVC